MALAVKASIQARLRFEDDVHVFVSSEIEVAAYEDIERALTKVKEEFESMLARQRVEDLLGE